MIANQELTRFGISPAPHQDMQEYTTSNCGFVFLTAFALMVKANILMSLLERASL
jgi:hypothetical protein